MLAKAIAYATKKHALQKRKHLQIQFIDHPMRVMHYIIQDAVYGGNDETATIAILHDVVEDCADGEQDEHRAPLYTEMTALFSTHVRWGVHELTNEYTTGRYPEMNRQDRKDKELERLLCISDRGRTIKLYDRLCNLEDTIRAAKAAPKFTSLFARESWDLAFALATPDNGHVSGRVMTLAAQLRDMV